MMRDIVGGAGCDPGQSSNSVGQFVNAVTEGAQMAERFQGLGMPPPPQDKDDEQLFAQYMQNLKLYNDEMEKFGNLDSNFHNEEDLNNFLAADFPMPEDINWTSKFWNEQMRNMLHAERDPYKFEPGFANPFLDKPDSFERGKELFHQGTLGEAVLAFEAAVQQDPNNSDAWRFLGTAHAFNDQDKMAIGALRQAVQTDPENIEALLDLGVSCTNELAQNEAMSTLKNWLRMHPEYREIHGLSEGDVIDQGIPELERVITMFVRASEIQNSDPDVFVVLGVLYNLSRDFDKAEKAFDRALELDPSDFSVWNKLGATQANSPKPSGSKDAIACYRRALELKPNYVRAWVNMGISYANRRMHDLAAKYYLKALSLNAQATHVWTYLETALAWMNRSDLEAKLQQRNVELFREEFKF